MRPRRSAVFSWRMSTPPKRTSPLSGGYRPMSSLPTVDLPDPTRPMMPTRSPGRMFSEMSSSEVRREPG